MTSTRGGDAPVRIPCAPVLDADALRARARALCDRAAVVSLQSGLLCAATVALHASATGALGRSSSARLTRARWAPVPQSCLSQGPRSGRLLRVTSRRVRRVAAQPMPPDARGEAQAPPSDHWAHAVVYETRVVDGIPRFLLSSPDDAVVYERWTVRELDTTTLPGALGARCLVFENHSLVRRLWVYPSTWATLPAESLLRLAGIPA